jgi:MraZ protein
MTFVFGEFDISMDVKGRFLLPGGLRKQLSDAELDVFMINRSQENCLNLYTKDGWEAYSAKVVQQNTFEYDDRMFKRLYFNGATWVNPDSAGRLLLPKHLLQYANLDKDITMIGMGDYTEIWDTEVYKKLLADNQPNYTTLSNKVMGGQQSNG